MIHRESDADINYIDTADGYSLGESEEIVDRALKGRRDSVVVGTTVRFYSEGERVPAEAHADRRARCDVLWPRDVRTEHRHVAREQQLRQGPRRARAPARTRSGWSDIAPVLEARQQPSGFCEAR